ncbi:MAG: hypothetical protein KDK24_12230 [Pseudooceanicola sp.]|nr:hypothetical protein [Pseudooceanicola sp.]
MGKDLDKLKTAFKKLQPKFKPYSETAGTKIRKAMQDALNTAWDVETEVRDAITKAVEEGEKGKKIADFEADANFSKSFKAWKKACGDHKGEIKKLSDFCGEAEKLRDEIKGYLDKAEKEVKKDKPSGKEAKALDKFMGEVKTEVDGLTAAANVYGTIKFVELFYAAKEDATMQKILKKTADKAGGVDLPKILEAGARSKGEKQVEKLASAIADAYGALLDEPGGNPKEKGKQMNLADGMLDKLTKLNKTYQDALKKQKKEIEASPEKKEIMELIERVAELFEACQDMKGEATKAVKKAA